MLQCQMLMLVEQECVQPLCGTGLLLPSRAWTNLQDELSEVHCSPLQMVSSAIYGEAETGVFQKNACSNLQSQCILAPAHAAFDGGFACWQLCLSQTRFLAESTSNASIS